MLALWMLIVHLVVARGAEVDILCSEEFCAEERENKGCEDVIPEGCESKGVMLQSPTPCNCCKYCISYLDKGATCDEGVPTAGTVTSICGPELTCENGKCVDMKNLKCKDKQKEYDSSNSFAEISWRPICDSEGDFGPIHCIPNSVCYCIEPENGERIFGEAIYSSQASQQMSCSCSLSAWYASTLGDRASFFRCLSDGQYDALQCVDGECRCVDETTGAPVGTTSVHVNKLKEDVLPCFDKNIHTEGKFEKPCELEYKTLLDEMTTWEYQGMEVLNVILPKCTPDGNYDRVYEHRNGNGFKCVDPQGNTIDSYESDTGKSDCNCAFTTWLLKKAGIHELPICRPDGTFKEYQCFRDKCYCVDANGDQTGDHVAFSEVKELECEN